MNKYIKLKFTINAVVKKKKKKKKKKIQNKVLKE